MPVPAPSRLRDALEDLALAFDALATRARELNLLAAEPQLDSHVADLTAAGRAIVAAHAEHPEPVLATQLDLLREKVEALAIPARDRDRDHSHTFTAMQEGKGLVLVRLRDALAAARALGWNPEPTAPPGTARAIVPRAEAPADFAAITAEFRNTAAALTALAAALAQAPPPVVQRGIFNTYIRRMDAEVKLAVVQTEIGTGIDLGAISRILAAVSTLTIRFTTWLSSAWETIAPLLRTAADRTRATIIHTATAIAETVQRIATGRAKPPPPPTVGPPEGFSLIQARRLIETGQAPPQDWAPFLNALVHPG